MLSRVCVCPTKTHAQIRASFLPQILAARSEETKNARKKKNFATVRSRRHDASHGLVFIEQLHELRVHLFRLSDRFDRVAKVGVRTTFLFMQNATRKLIPQGVTRRQTLASASVDASENKGLVRR